MTKPLPRIRTYGDHALDIQFGLIECDRRGFDAAINDAVHTLAAQLKSDSNWMDIMTGYDSLVVTFDSTRLSLNHAKRAVEDMLIRKTEDSLTKPPSRLLDIPVNYGGEYGPDLPAICRSSGLSERAVIERHSAQPYHVCMMGFLPGFAFLSEAPKALHHPRHKTPRARVPAGSIGIANWQTGIYGLDSPGGWQIIGQTDLILFDKANTPPSLIQAGDQIRFIPQ